MRVFVTICVIVITVAQEQYFRNNSSLKLVQILFRHGERSPTETYPNDPHIDHNWPGGFGLLNNRGKLEMYDLGVQLRKYYANFLPEYYFRSEIMLYSSYADRCLMSAQLLLAGLFPPVGEQIWNPDLLWQPIPVHYNPRISDNIIAMKQACPKYDKALKDSYKSDKVKEIEAKYPDLYEYLSNHTGSDVKDIKDVEFLYNTLEIEELNNLTLPNWTEKYYPEPMRTIAAESLALFTYTSVMKRLSGGVFVANITENMRQTLEMKSKNVLFLYSGHDLTVVNVMRTLGYESLLKPDFAATLIFELHSNDNRKDVKILFKKNITESIQELSIPNCTAPCSFDTFVEVLQPILPVNWTAECLEEDI